MLYDLYFCFSCIIEVNCDIAGGMEQRRTNTHEWKEQIPDFWNLLPHFWEVDNVVPDSSYDFSGIINSSPDLLFGEEAGITFVDRELTGEVDMGASYDFGFL